MSLLARALVIHLAIVVSAFGGNSADRGQILIKFKQGRRTRSQTESLYESLRVAKVERFRGGARRVEVLSLERDSDVKAALERAKAAPIVEWAQLNSLIHVDPVAFDSSDQSVPHPASASLDGFVGAFFAQAFEGPGNRPDLKDPPADVFPPVSDPDIGKTYGMKIVGATEAWKTWRGSQSFIVAEIGTGVDYNHEDLSFNMWRNRVPGPKHDVVGYDFVHDDGLPFDDHGYSTGNAGVIGAVGGNGKGISGIAGRVSIMAIKVFSEGGSGDIAEVIKGIDYAIDHGAKVINAAWGGGGSDPALLEAIQRAEAKGVIFVASSGKGANNIDEEPVFPASFHTSNMIVVTGTDGTDHLAPDSPIGPKTIDIAAPGSAIYTTTPGGGYAVARIAKFEVAHVAGSLALIWSKHATWSYDKVKRVLLETSDKLPELGGKMVSGGRVNVVPALSETP